MRKLGVIVAMKSEFAYLYDKIGEFKESIVQGNVEVYRYERNNIMLYVVDTAEGEIAASCMTQYLISQFGVEGILNFGLCGSLKPEYKCGDLVVVRDVIHYDFDISALNSNCGVGVYPNKTSPYWAIGGECIKILQEVYPLREVRVASADKFVGSVALKNALVQDYNADICEMEAAGIAVCCDWNKVDCLLIKCISDNAEEDAHREFREVVNEGVEQFMQVVTQFLDAISQKN